MTTKEIGFKIKNLRIDKRLTQRQVAQRLGCSFSLINHFEKGNKNLALEDAFKLELILGCNSGEISGDIIQLAYEKAGCIGKAPTNKYIARTSEDVFNHKHKSPERVAGAEIEANVDGRVIRVPVKLPRDLYLKLEFE